MSDSKEKSAVDIAIEEIKKDIRSYSIIYIRPDINGMNTILRDLPPEDFNELFRKLDEVAASELGRETYSPAAEIREAARDTFGTKSSFQAAADADFWDDTMRAEARGKYIPQKTLISDIIEMAKRIYLEKTVEHMCDDCHEAEGKILLFFDKLRGRDRYTCEKCHSRDEWFRKQNSK